MGNFFKPEIIYTMTEVEKTPVDTEIKEEKEVMDHEHPHPHDHEEEGEGKGHKASRGEKKFKKSLVKMGMKQVTGTNRVTFKTNKNFVLYIDEPDILKSNDTSFVIFGEAKFLDFSGDMAGEKAQNFQKAEEAKAKEPVAMTKEAEAADDDDEEEDQGDIEDEKIATLMEYQSCSRAKAIRALKKTGGD